MESALMRKEALNHFIAANAGANCSISALAHDASFRRYFRIQSDQGTFLVMDAPPHKENTRPFIAISNALRQLSLNTPEVLVADIEQGFLLITDFGDATYLSQLKHDNADELYQRALKALFLMQSCDNVMHHPLPMFSTDFMQTEWSWHKEWFADKWLKLDMSLVTAADASYATLVNEISQQPYVFMHRDFHAGNLMVLPQDVGILDFQDAFIGPITYDLASLLRDCYIAWPEDKVTSWVDYYFDLLQSQPSLPKFDKPTFKRWFDWMSVQRHLKALMTFARKNVRDQQPGYLQHIPRTLQYLLQTTARYPELTPIKNYLQCAQ